MKEQIIDVVTKILKELGADDPVVSLEPTEDLSHGDYATSVSLANAKDLKMAPKKLAEKIVDKISKEKLQGVEKIEVAGPGFINFFLTPSFFQNATEKIISAGFDFGKNKNLEGQKIMIEYTDANPFKEFHAGHVMSNTIGESLARIIEFSGAEVRRACYQGDVGLHVAKTIWGIKQNSVSVHEPHSKSVEMLGKAYVHGSKMYEEDPAIAEEIKSINKKIFEKSDPEINELYEWGRKVSLDHFEEIYKKLGTKFDYYFFESEVAPLGMFVVEELIAKKILEKSEGAIIFRGEEYGLHTRVFVNKEGLPTYETKELGLAKSKDDLYPAMRSLSITGNEQNDYFKVVIKVMEFAFASVANKIRHISHGMLRFTDGKMSSRTGNILTGESLIQLTEEIVLEKMKDREMNADLKKEIAEMIAVAAIKYSILRQAIGKDIIFEFDKSVSFEGDSGPYLQYSATRAGSILTKAKTENVKEGTDTRPDSVFDFEKKLHRFLEVVERAQAELAPQYIATYLIDLAGSFNNFYATEQIIKKDDAHSSYKIALTHAFQIVMTNGLHLLGIKTPEKM